MDEGSQERLRTSGHRVTPQRGAVLRALRGSPRPLSAAEVHGRAKRHYRRLGLVTVYRTLELLEALGLVRRIHGDGACQAFTASSPGHYHAITCERCARTVEFDGDQVCLLTAEVERKTGYRVQGHWLQLTGTCPSCLQKEADR